MENLLQTFPFLSFQGGISAWTLRERQTDTERQTETERTRLLLKSESVKDIFRFLMGTYILRTMVPRGPFLVLPSKLSRTLNYSEEEQQVS